MDRKRMPGRGVVAAGRVAGRTRSRAPHVRVPRIDSRVSGLWLRGSIALAMAGLLATGGYWLYTSPLLTIDEVAVEGNSVLTAGEARGIAAIEGNSLFDPEFSEAEARLAALPIVKTVDISRDFPNDARITITERSAWGLWQTGERRVAIDDEGVVVDLPAPPGAPVIVQIDPGAQLPAPGERVDAGAVDVVRQLTATAQQTLGRTVLSLEYAQASGLTVVLSNTNGDGGLRVLFGDGQGYEFKVAALFAVLQQASGEGRSLSRVDLRFGDRVAVQ